MRSGGGWHGDGLLSAALAALQLLAAAVCCFPHCSSLTYGELLLRGPLRRFFFAAPPSAEAPPESAAGGAGGSPPLPLLAASMNGYCACSLTLATTLMASLLREQARGVGFCER